MVHNICSNKVILILLPRSISTKTCRTVEWYVGTDALVTSSSDVKYKFGLVLLTLALDFFFFFFFFFISEVLPWANLSVLHKEPVFRSAQQIEIV